MNIIHIDTQDVIVPIYAVEISDDFDLTNSDFEEDSEEQNKSIEKVNKPANV